MRMPTSKTAPMLVAAIAILAMTCGLSTASAATLSGTVQSGGDLFKIPVISTPVKLYEATIGTPTVLGTATTNFLGQFTMNVEQTTSQSIFFVVADLGKSVQLVAVLGPNLPGTIVVNELTTVAASYSMAQFYKTGMIAGKAFPLQLAAMMNDNLVNVVTGAPSQVLLSAPNADQTNSLRSTRALANALAACTANRALAAYFLELTTPQGGPAPASTPQGLANLARDPGRNVLAIYLLTKTWIPYVPGLLLAPDAWTITVKVNNTGNDAYMFGGPGNIAFDANGYAWMTNNVIQGQSGSSPAVVVLKPNGKPADGLNSTPKSPIVAGGILGTGFGVTIDPSGSIWFGNFGWGGVNPTATGNGSVSQFTPLGIPISPPLAYQGGPVRAQATVSDSVGNIWIASFGTNQLFVFKNGNPNTHVCSPPLYTGAQCFDIQIATDGTAWLVSGGGFTGTYKSNVSRYQLNDHSLTSLSSVDFPVGRAMKGASIDSFGNCWVASQGDSKVYVFAPSGALLTSFGGSLLSSINGPWSVTVDSEDNVWVANFGPLVTGSNFTNTRITKLAGANAATRPPGKNMGDEITPWSGYTLPSAGSQVLLHNGTPLYGSKGPISFSPMTRLTNTVIDQAGNLWALNNWKPSFDIDSSSTAGNPGGDGIVIFVGLAPPRPAPPVRQSN
ncbi:MAG: uncharacterized protein JWP89_214 [Schlesneria sp.]|nr:uncharacterized protein [Schlesneria sp.]